MNKEQLYIRTQALKYITSDLDDQIHTRPYFCSDKECYDRGNFHISCNECPKFFTEPNQTKSN